MVEISMWLLTETFTIAINVWQEVDLHSMTLHTSSPKLKWTTLDTKLNEHVSGHQGIAMRKFRTKQLTNVSHHMKPLTATNRRLRWTALMTPVSWHWYAVMTSPFSLQTSTALVSSKSIVSHSSNTSFPTCHLQPLSLCYMMLAVFLLVH